MEYCKNIIKAVEMTQEVVTKSTFLLNCHFMIHHKVIIHLYNYLYQQTTDLFELEELRLWKFLDVKIYVKLMEKRILV